MSQGKMVCLGLVVFILIVLCIARGFSSKDNELICQVKYVEHKTPLICPDYMEASVSLGVMKDGVGSMSVSDKHLTVRTDEQYKILQTAVKSAKLVRIIYDMKRAGGDYWICTPEYIVKKVEILD
jgi:hypothetical protein